MTPDRRTIFALFSLAFGLRILYAAIIGTLPDVIANPYTHDFLAGARIAEGARWWSRPVSPYAPGYQFLLALLFRIGGANYWLVVVLHAAIGGVTAFFLYRIGEKCLGRHVGLLAAVWFSFFVHHLHYSSIVLRDVTTTMLFVYVCYLMVLYTHRMRGAVWTGIVFTLLLHFDPQYLFFFPLIALYFLFYATRHKLLNLQFLFLFLGCVLMLLLPWTVRNQRVYGDVIPIGLEAVRYARPVKRLVAADVPRPDVVRNAVELWRVTRFGDKEPSRSGDRPPEPAWSLRHNLVNIATYGVLLPFFLVGIWTAVRRRHRPALVLASAVGFYFLIRVFYGGYERLRLPIEPLIILLAFYAIVDLYGRLRARRAGSV